MIVQPQPSSDFAARVLQIPKNVHATVQFSANDNKLDITKVKGESVKHLLLKALLWAIIAKENHANTSVEKDIGFRYTPDVVALDHKGEPMWWGECGSVSKVKLKHLTDSLPRTRFTLAKWGRSDVRGYAASLRSELKLPRYGPIDVISFPDDSPLLFVRDDGSIDVTFDELYCLGRVERV